MSEAITHFATILSARSTQVTEEEKGVVSSFLKDCHIRPGTFFRGQVVQAINLQMTAHSFIYELVEDTMFAFATSFGGQDDAYTRLCNNLAFGYDVTGPDPRLCSLPVQEKLWSAANALADVNDIEQQGTWLQQSRLDPPTPEVLASLLLNNRHLVFVAMCTYMSILTPKA
jgi:hypothetical protein